MAYIEVYYREKDSLEWKTAKGYFESDSRVPSVAYMEYIIEDLARVYSSQYEFDSNCLFIKGEISDLGRYTLDGLFKHDEIKTKYSFCDREDLGFRDWSDDFISIVVPRPLKNIVDGEVPPF